MSVSSNILIAFYGDDFTGSTDALESLSKAGAKTILFLDDPTEAQLQSYVDFDAIGIAGMTRTMDPETMKRTLEKSFGVLKSLKPRHVHYKVCSTFDSSPEIGNIGMAIETGQQVFKNEFTPVLVAAPTLGRYAAFGHLFARMGIGTSGDIYRLDRHPSMSKHPVTPADESDLRKHLAKQIGSSSGLIDLTDLENSIEEINSKIRMEVAQGRNIIFFDAMYAYQMPKIGEVLNGFASHQPLFSVGSSGINNALGDFWNKTGRLKINSRWRNLKEGIPILVLSGSLSPVTEEQIRHAVANGFQEVPIQVDVLEGGSKASEHIQRYSAQIQSFLECGHSVILHTSKGPDDPRVAQASQFFQRQGYGLVKMRTQAAMSFGKALGQSALRALKEVPVNRLVIAGGDTSSYVARELGIQAVEMIAPVYPGSPLCQAHAPGSPVDGIEVNLKGGQVGDQAYFSTLLNGNI